jgi:hypothetical protein
VAAEPGRSAAAGKAGSVATATTASDETRRWALAFALALLLVPVALQLRPGTDQMLFLDYSTELLGGATLYVDLWDNKQPGIFWLYAGMQALLGAGWTKLLAGYAAWMCAAAATGALVARVAAPAGRAWLLAVPFTLGVVWLRSNPDQVAQIEEWVALPLSAILLLASRAEPAGAPARGRWVAIGALAGVVALLKLVLAPVAVAIVAAVFVVRMATDRLPVRHLAVALACASAGVALVWLPVLAGFAARGAWDAFWWTTFEYPRLAVGATERAPTARLVSTLGWLAKSTFMLVPGFALALLAAWRAPRSPLARVVAGALAWGVAGLAMVLAQKFSWWAYHMPLLVWPMGLLAAIGCASAWSGAGASRTAARVACVIGLAGLALHGAWLGSKWLRGTDWPYATKDRAAMVTAREVARTATPVCGTSVAIGDQNGLQSATGLKRAMATNAVFWGAFLPAQVERLPDELHAARPDLVFMDADQRDDLARRHPDVLARIEAWLAVDYMPRATDALGGRWWERAPAARGAACPASRAPFAIPGR